MGIQIFEGILHGDSKFSREFCMGIQIFEGILHGDPNFRGNFAWGSKFSR